MSRTQHGTTHSIQTQVHTTPVWRLVGTAAAIAGVIAIGYSLALTDLIDEFSIWVSSAFAFLVQHIIFRDPETIRRLAGSFAPLAESVFNLRKAVRKKGWVQLVPTALGYGVIVLLIQKAVYAVASMFATWWIAVGIGLVVISLVVMPELWKMSKEELIRKSPIPAKAADEDEDDEPFVLPTPPTPKKAEPVKEAWREKAEPVVVRLRVPAGQVQPAPLEPRVSAYGVDAAALAADINEATTDLEGRVPISITITPGGDYAVAVIADNPHPETPVEAPSSQYPSRRDMRLTAQEGAA